MPKQQSRVIFISVCPASGFVWQNSSQFSRLTIYCRFFHVPFQRDSRENGRILWLEVKVHSYVTIVILFVSAIVSLILGN